MAGGFYGEYSGGRPLPKREHTGFPPTIPA